MTPASRPAVKIAPNNPVFDLPVIVGIEEGLFAKAGLDVSFSASYADREKDSADKPVLARLKEGLFECGSADSYNVCEWASIDRLERGKRDGKVAALRAAIAAQAIWLDEYGTTWPLGASIFTFNRVDCRRSAGRGSRTAHTAR